MAQETLFTPLQIDARRLLSRYVPVNIWSASAYEKVINEHFAPEAPVFDMILLGLGDNSHTASLFPYTDVLSVAEQGVRSVFLEDKQVYRITFTAPLINQASHIVFMVFGAGKAEAVHHVLQDEKNIDLYPAQLIKAENGDLFGF